MVNAVNQCMKQWFRCEKVSCFSCNVFFLFKAFVLGSHVLVFLLRDRHHCSDRPADVDRVKSLLDVHLGVPQGILGVVQNLKADVHHIVLKLGERRLREIMSHICFLLITFNLCVCLTPAPPPVCPPSILFACLAHTASLFAFPAVLPVSCDGTSPCLCGLVTF